MIEWWYAAQLWYLIPAGLVLIGIGLIGRRPNGFSISVLAIAEFGLLMQLVASITLIILGERPVFDTWEFFGYLVVALMVPLAGGLWAFVESSKWSNVVMGATLLTVAVMLVRMVQIWTGVNPVPS